VQKRNHNTPKEQVSSRLEDCYLKATAQELMIIMSSEWLKESEASSDVIRLLSCFTTIRCLISRTPMDSLYDPAVGASVMSKNLTLTLLGEEPLVLTEKFLKLPSRELVESCGLAQNMSVVISKVHVLLNFYIFDVEDIDLLIGHPLMRFIDGFHRGHLKGQLGKNLNLSIPYVGSINAKIEPNLKTDPIEEVIAATHLEASQPNLEEEAKDYIEVLETELDEPLELDESEPPPKPSIELKPLLPRLKYVFLNSDRDSPVIISDQLSEEEAARLITVLEKYRSVLGYSLQDFKRISPALCTHRIPIEPDATPSRECWQSLLTNHKLPT